MKIYVRNYQGLQSPFFYAFMLELVLEYRMERVSDVYG